MKKLIYFFTLSIFLLSAVSCNGGRKTASSDKSDKTVVSVGSFHSVRANNGIRVILTDCQQGKVTVRADKRYREYLRIKVVNGVLTLSVKDGDFKKKRAPKGKIEVLVPDKKVDGIYGSTGAHFIAEDIKSKNSVIVNLSTGSVFRGKITAKSVSVNLSTGSAFDSFVCTDDFSMDQATGTVSTLSGSAKNASLVSSTGSTSRWGDMKIGYLDADLSTASTATVDAEVISVGVSTAGTLRYKGLPKIKNIDVSTAGSVRSVK